MSVINEAKGGADLTHPKMSVGYLISASVAVVILLLVFGVGSYLYRKSKAVVTGATGTITAGNQIGMSGIFGDGT